jgi:NADH:ubiquinone reductase (H+-translocating)
MPKQKPAVPIANTSKIKEEKNIVILGGGFAGVRAALDLAEQFKHKPDYQVILVDRKDYQTYYSALYEAATAEHGLVEAKKVKRAVTIPYDAIFGKSKVKVHRAYIEGIDVENGMITTDSRILPYDYLVIAMGSIVDYYGITNLDKHGFSLKSLEDAIMIRNRVEEIVTKKDSAELVIGGGGFTGSEFAGELHNLIRHECQTHGKNPENFKLMIVEGAPSLLPGLSEKVASILHDRFQKKGIEMRFSTLITEAGKDHVVLNNKERISCDLLVWTGGVRSCRLPVGTDLERDKKDRTPTTDFLNLKKYPRVFLAGDDLCFMDPSTKKPVPQTAQEAIRQGSHVARNISLMADGKDMRPYFPGPPRYVIPAAGKFAVFYSQNLILSGFPGWIIRKAADFRYFWSVMPLFKAMRYAWFETQMFMKND